MRRKRVKLKTSSYKNSNVYQKDIVYVTELYTLCESWHEYVYIKIRALRGI